VGHPAQPPAQAGSPRAGCTGPRPGGSGISQRQASGTARSPICGIIIQILKKLERGVSQPSPAFAAVVSRGHSAAALLSITGLRGAGLCYSRAIINTANKTCPAAPGSAGQGSAARLIPREGPAHTLHGDIQELGQPRAPDSECQRRGPRPRCWGCCQLGPTGPG